MSWSILQNTTCEAESAACWTLPGRERVGHDRQLTDRGLGPCASIVTYSLLHWQREHRDAETGFSAFVLTPFSPVYWGMWCLNSLIAHCVLRLVWDKATTSAKMIYYSQSRTDYMFLLLNHKLVLIDGCTCLVKCGNLCSQSVVKLQSSSLCLLLWDSGGRVPTATDISSKPQIILQGS